MKEEKIVKKILDNLIYLGECRCGGHIVSSTNNPKTERFTVYCTECGSVSDVRFPKKGDMYNLATAEETPLKLLIRLYETKKYYITENDVLETPISKDVNKLHGEV